MSNPDIRFVANCDIDRTKWDQCIAQSPFGIAYAFSWYLDRICPKWDALISDNYLYIMPLTHNKKYGISYIYQPFFAQQLGVFSTLPVDTSMVDLFLNTIPPKFRLTEMNLNLGNSICTNNFTFKKNTTYHLNLQPDIAEIRSGYSTNTRRNIQKAFQNNISILQFSDVPAFIEFTHKNLKEKSPEIKGRHYSALLSIINYALNNNLGEIYIAQTPESKLLASAFFLKAHQTCIYLAASSNTEGIQKSAMFLLIDTFVKNSCGNKLNLDFEGSNIQGIARFYKGFGAIPKTYYAVRQNRLPALLRLFKK